MAGQHGGSPRWPAAQYHRAVADTRRTKIVATLGPASSEVATIRRMVGAGLDVVRLNFSHIDLETAGLLIERVRAAERELDKPIAIIGDLQGRKLRIGPLDQPVAAVPGMRLRLAPKPLTSDLVTIVC